MQVVSAQTYRIEHDPAQVSIEQLGTVQKVQLKGITDISTIDRKEGDPELPVYYYRILLSPGEKVASYAISGTEWEEVAREISVKPSETLWHQYAEKKELSADKLPARGMYPAENIVYDGIQHLHGYPIAHFRIYPFRYDSENNRLELMRSVDVSIEKEQSGEQSIYREVATEWDRQSLSRQLENLVDNVEQVPGAMMMSETLTPGGMMRLDDLDRYVVITSDALRDAYLPLVEWKTRKGVPAAIVTIEEIRNRFPEGKDDAERIRNFIRYSYRQRGTVFVLMGGDTDIVPTRVVTTGYYTFPTDYYYSDLDGSWNADQDEIFGEAADELEAYPEVYVSRIPVRTNAEVSRFISRLFKYEKLEGVVDPDYFSRVLYLAANLKRDNDGRDLILNHVDPQINPDFDRVMITQTADVGSDGSVAMNELNKNYGIIFSEAHGAYHTFRPGASGSNIYNYMIEDIANQEPGIWYMASCETNDILKRAISEVFMLAENGGGVAYIGNTSWEYPFSGIYLQKEFFNLVFSRGYTHLAEAHFLSRYPYLGHISSEGPARVIVFSTLVLGDPEMPVWTARPVPVSPEEAVQIKQGYNETDVSVIFPETGLPVSHARVVLYQPGGIYYAAQTDESGVARLAFTVTEETPVHVTIVKQNAIPYEATIPVNESSGPRLEIEDVTLSEITGNGNDRCEPGETFEFMVTFKNSGAESFHSALISELTSVHPAVVLQDSIFEWPEIPDIGQSVSTGPYTFQTARTIQQDTTLVFHLTVRKHDGTAGVFAMDVPLKAGRIGICNRTVDSEPDPDNPGYTVTYIDLCLENRGAGTSTGVVAELTGLPDSIIVINRTIQYGDIEPGSEKWGRQRFSVSHPGLPDALSFGLQLTDQNGQTRKQTLNLTAPSRPGAVWFTPFDAQSIALHWEAVSDKDIMGYHIYRKTVKMDTFHKITKNPVPIAGYYVDNGLEAGDIYEYSIETIDSSGNVSEQSEQILQAWTSLPFQPGFPLQLDLKSIGSEMNGIQAVDLDNNGLREIVASGANGVLEVLDSEGLVISFVSDMEGNLTAPAIGNVYGDAADEVVVSSYTEGQNINGIYVINPLSGAVIHHINLGYNAPTHALLDDLDGDDLDEIIVMTHAANAPEGPRESRLFIWRSTGSAWHTFPGWPQEGYPFTSKINLGNPAVGDLSGNGKKNIVVGSYYGDLYCFQPADSSGPVWIKSYPGILNSPLSLADINRDGTKEIVATAPREDKLYVFKHDGDPLPGWEGGKDVDPTDPYSRTSPAVIGNMDDDAFLEIVMVGRRNVYVFEHTGVLAEGWPVAVRNGNSYIDDDPKPWGVYSSPVLADLDVNGVTDIVFVTSNGKLNALDGVSGKPVVGFPVDINNSLVRGQSPLVTDLDLDGDLEILLIGHDGILMTWDMPYTYSGEIYLEWPGPMANNKNSGHYLPQKITQNPNALVSEEGQGAIPAQFVLEQNYPNPFNPETTIRYRITDPFSVATQNIASLQNVELTVHNIIGQKIATLVSGKQPVGHYTVQWNARAFPSGVYFYRLTVSNENNRAFQHTRKMVLLK